MSAAKRARTNGAVVQRSARRPIGKHLISVFSSSLDGTQTATTLFTTTYPGTVTGLRWDLSAVAKAGTETSRLWWAVVVVKDGLSASTMATSNAAEFYTPEQNVLAFGVSVLKPSDEGGQAVQFNGDTKTMRKLQPGDLLQFLAVSEATNTAEYHGVIQFFVKS